MGKEIMSQNKYKKYGKEINGLRTSFLKELKGKLQSYGCGEDGGN